MKSNFLKSFLALLAIAMSFAFVGCIENEEGDDDSYNFINLSSEGLAFTQVEESKTVDILTEAKWESVIPSSAQSWVTVTPAQGKGKKTVTVSVAANTTGAARSAKIKFWTLHPEYGQWDGKTLIVSQSASEEEIEELEQFFYDNFDKTEAVKETYWPWFDATYANPTGDGAATVSYESNGITARANSTSDSSYSDYSGSGKNNLFFGSSAYVVIKDIILPADKDCFVLTFGTEMYNQDTPDELFALDKFHVYISGDNTKWSEITYAFAEGDDIKGRWNDATASFKLASVPEKLSIKFVADLASVYRVDDVTLYSGGEGTQTIDLSQGGTGTGGSGSDTPSTPSEPLEGVFFSDNFDKTTAVKEGDYWPYFDATYANPTGEGAATVSYDSNNITARANSASNGSYSNYAGSGKNNLFFGKVENFVAIKDITLPSGVDTFFLTFGAEKYTQSGDSTFSYDEFHVYLSGDNTNWIEIDYAFASGDNLNGTWNDATATFKITNVPAKLSIKFVAGVASVYRLDDVALGVADSASQNVTLGEGGGSTGGQEPGEGGGSDEPTGDEITVTEAISAAKDSAVKLKESTVVAVSAKSYLLTDGTSYILAYKGDDPGLAVGDKVTVTGTIGAYRSVPQIASPVATKTGHDDSFAHPTATVMDGAAIDAYAAMAAGTTYIKYVKVEGELVKSDAYWNLTVEGASTGQGSISYPTAAMCPDSYSGKKVTVYGYTIYQTRDTDVNIIATQVVAEGVEPGEGDDNGDDNGNEGGDDSGDDVVSDADVVVNFADVSVYPSDFPVAKANITVARNEYTFGGYTFAFAGSEGAGYYQVAPTGTYTDCYVLFGKTGAYIELPALAGKSLKKIVATSRSGASGTVQVAVKTTSGAVVDGGAAITWAQTAPYKYTYNLTGTTENTPYRLTITNDKNAQITLLELYYSAGDDNTGDDSGDSGEGDGNGDDSGDQGGDDSGEGDDNGDDNGNEGGDDSGDSGNEAEFISVADFKALPDNENDADTTLYTLKGTITSVENTTYGNFWLMDDTGSVLIYGLNSPEGAAQYWATSGAKVGDDIVVKTIRSQYGNSPQGKNALFVSLQSPGTRAFWSFAATAASFTAAGGEKTISVDAYNIKNEVTVSSNNAQFSGSYANGVLTITAKENSSESSVEGVVTVICGALSQAIAVSQLGASSGEQSMVEAKISFADKANRTSFTTSQQVWEQNGIKVTNDKGASTSNVGDYSNPARFYKSSNVKIEAPGAIVSIAIDCKGLDAKYVTPWGTAENGIVTIKGDGSSTTYSFNNLSAQARAYSITVTYLE